MYRSDDWISDLYHREKLNKKKEISKNYYYDKDKVVFTEHFLLNRGFCCNNNCRHCPYLQN
jgi:hypothetical protein